MPRQSRAIADEETLTQYGTTTDGFHQEPRSHEAELSLLLGDFHPLMAGDHVRRQALGDGTDAARYTTAGTLRQQGFTVEHTPSKRIAEHVSVSKDGVWDADVCQSFNECFGEVEADDTDYRDEEEEGDDE